MWSVIGGWWLVEALLAWEDARFQDSLLVLILLVKQRVVLGFEQSLLA